MFYSDREICPTCHGGGSVAAGWSDAIHGGVELRELCGRCGGGGTVRRVEELCTSCGGYQQRAGCATCGGTGWRPWE
jgi:DnaJ-class molecular chaperone